MYSTVQSRHLFQKPVTIWCEVATTNTSSFNRLQPGSQLKWSWLSHDTVCSPLCCLTNSTFVLQYDSHRLHSHGAGDAAQQVDWSSTNQAVCGLIPGPRSLHVGVSFGKIPDLKLLPLAPPSMCECTYEWLSLLMSRWLLAWKPQPPVCECVCEWMNADLL